MAWTADKIAAEELFESPEVLERKANILADLIRKSKHFIVFTGAGVSTSAGIPDFRGPDGAWTLRAQGRQRTTKAVSTLQAIPTVAHMALVELQHRGLLRHVISQNCDGLHRKSGILPQNISELHGNSNLEYCTSCGKEYLRDFRAVSTYEKSIHDHHTGRRCALCGGKLLDSIINFGESLPAKHKSSAFAHAKKADLCLVLGSSLRVTPANEVPKIVGRKKSATLAVCNLQETPLDDITGLRIHTRADDLMVRVMEKLNLPIPPFVLHRCLTIIVEKKASDNYRIILGGVDTDRTPASFLRSVKIQDSRRSARSEPFILIYREALQTGDRLAFELEFMGHYGEPNLRLEHVYDDEQGGEALYDLWYDPQNGQWKSGRMAAGLVSREELR